MNLQGVKVNDIVYVDVKGRTTYATVTNTDKGILTIQPIGDRTFTWRTVNSRQVKAHWRRSSRSTINPLRGA